MASHREPINCGFFLARVLPINIFFYIFSFAALDFPASRVGLQSILDEKNKIMFKHFVVILLVGICTHMSAQSIEGAWRWEGQNDQGENIVADVIFIVAAAGRF